jgi:hypothetical protein
MRPLVTLAVALLVLVGVGACRPNTATSHPAYCSVIGGSPDRDAIKSPEHIVASAHFWCDDPGAEKLTLTVRLQKQNSKGAWVDAVHRTFTGRGAETTRPKTASYREWTVSIPCADGDFRTVVTGSSLSRKVTKTYDYTGPTAHDPCQATIFA